MRTVFDLGMYDGADAQYYLESGFRVIAVEANPDLIASAKKKFASYLSTGQLVCVNEAISASGGPVELILCGDDLGSSSIHANRIAARPPIGAIQVPGTTTQRLIQEFGVPYFIKCDIEGADRFCVLGLDAARRPQYLSYEAEEDFEELLQHCRQIGFTKFKIINQVSFRELANEDNLRDRVILGVLRRLGYAEPQFVRRAGRFFVSGHCAGPAPWSSDGVWQSAEEAFARWKRGRMANAWYDVHASA